MATATINRTTPPVTAPRVDWDAVKVPFVTEGNPKQGPTYAGVTMIVTEVTDKYVTFFHAGPNAKHGRDGIGKDYAHQYLKLPMIEPEQPVVESVTLTLSVEETAALMLSSGRGEALPVKYDCGVYRALRDAAGLSTTIGLTAGGVEERIRKAA